MTTAAEVLRTHQEHPDWNSVLIAEALGCHDSYVRATAARKGIRLGKRLPRRCPHEWRSIDTAPKDGRWILVFDDAGGCHVACWEESVRDFIPHGWDLFGDCITTTHWMPLPEPPKPPEAAA